ncbi:histidine--tRNA ligase [Mesoterricola sediminis]|uniref:Histidine--tRNA ligase n=1 Tax=Mesoterricola sediminis TaxID=2927980 RepID=A0AA48GZQ0_9BACT|nr:histidine--tRNA ligase [Mesoterricola sediminis]BDU78595.1 histidine--tRNA ligase [Mesoterricola sediminis]
MAQSVKGTRDLFGKELDWFQRIEDTARRAFHRHGYREIRTPILEEIEVFKRSVGESSDIVHKEMYDFVDKGGRHVAMRPENTAGVVRAAIQHRMLEASDPQLLYYIGPMFRYERMQAGRYRQFWQIGAESFQVSTPESEAESLVMLYDFLRELGLEHLSFSINSVGTPECRPAFHEAFRAFFQAREAQFCDDCHRRIQENPLRVLDCKNASCQVALEGHPVMVDFLDPASREHHARLKEVLTELGLPFQENPRLVRGLDYYTRTAFEVLSSDLGAQSALLGGGRYDGLVKQLGGPQVAAFGWSIGLDRLAMLMQQLHGETRGAALPVLIPLGPVAALKALALARTWWAQGAAFTLETRGSALKKALTTANRTGAPLALLLGEGELEKGEVTVKDLAAGTQAAWTWDEVAERLRAHQD